jgi:general secretion pathway protein D
MPVRPYYLAVLRLLIVIALSLGLCSAEESARSLGRRAAKAEKAGQTAEAILLYNQADAKDPRNRTYAAKSRSLTERALRQSPPPVAVAAAAPTVESPVATIAEQELREAQRLLPPPELALGAGPYSIALRGPAREVIERTARQLGISVQFDQEFPESGSAIRLTVTGATGAEVLDTLSAATGAFFVPLQPKRMLVAKDTTQKRQELEPMVAVVLSLPEPVSVQEIQELARAVQQTMELQKFAIDNGRRLVLMRDRISKVRPAQQIFEQLMGARPAVAIELQVFELRRNRTLNAGTRLPTSTEIFAVAENPATGVDTRIPAIPLSSARIVEPQLAITLGDAAVVANLLRTVGSQVQRSEIRTMHGMPAQFAVGERYPILTAGFFGGEIGENAFRPPPTFQFENLGLTLKATPYTHGLGETTVEIEAEFKVLTGAQINGIPILANRKFISTVRLLNGEWAMMSGVGSSTRTLTKAGPAGLIQIPWVGALFRRNTVELDESETVVLLRPRLLGLPPSEELTREIRLGSETHPRIPH